jgi:hypothetical protein
MKQLPGVQSVFAPRLVVAILLTVFAAAPVHAGDRIQWIDPWAVDDLAGGAEAPDSDGKIDLPRQVETYRFAGGVAAPLPVYLGATGRYFVAAFAAGQIAMTGDRVRPIHPRR